MPDDVERAVDARYGREGDFVGFADAYPMLLTTTASLEDVNARLDQAVPMNRFRPNVVLDGTRAWDEDRWTRLQLGPVPVRLVKPCSRCVVTTTDQRTGERGVEPLRTLSTFRQRENDVLFGINAVPDAAGEIAVGDPVSVIA
jgi:uncharacterized protein YcbX